MADLEKLKTQVALLEKDAQSAELIHQRLETAIEKLTEITISLKGMLVQQETKLAKAEETDNDIFVTLESRRLEWDNDLKDLHSRITTNSRELREHQVQSESKMLYELRNLRQQSRCIREMAMDYRWRFYHCRPNGIKSRQHVDAIIEIKA